MAELVWKGKGRAGRAARRPLVDDELHGASSARGWRNRLVHGDAAAVLGSLGLSGQVALAYVDPPFNTGGDFDYLAAIPGAPEGTERVAVPAYRDTRPLDDWLAWFHDVACALHELLADGASLYVHLDAHAAHYAKVLLDEVFGPEAFLREIVWRIGWVSGFKSRARSWIRNHDTLLFYAKGGRPRTFHKEYVPYPPGYVRRDGSPPKGAGYPIEDVWNASDLDRMDSIQIVSFSGEKVGYPTQKNESLLARIVRASSSPGDLVLDCFAGSGTTAVVAEKLGRRWVASDASPVAIHATRRRLLALPTVSPFAVQRVDGDRAPRAGGELAAQVRVDGARCTIALTGFEPAPRTIVRETRAAVTHWSQWIDAWAVEWDHAGTTFVPATRSARRRGGGPLALEATHAYARPGRRVALVRAYDVLGGVTERTLPVTVARAPQPPRRRS